MDITFKGKTNVLVRSVLIRIFRKSRRYFLLDRQVEESRTKGLKLDNSVRKYCASWLSQVKSLKQRCKICHSLSGI